MKILILNGTKNFGHSQGSLNTYLTNYAKDLLVQNKCEVKITSIDVEYDIEEEIEKYLWCDVVIYQMPAWWMGPPWIVKKYIDEVFTAGYGKLYKNDGRSRSDSSKYYGSGGLLQGKFYMLSVTWNAPLAAFNEASQFFEGKEVDTVYFHFHKANQFLGLSPLPTFMANDVIKQPDVDQYIINYEQHLLENVVILQINP